MKNKFLIGLGMFALSALVAIAIKEELELQEENEARFLTKVKDKLKTEESVYVIDLRGTDK